MSATGLETFLKLSPKVRRAVGKRFKKPTEIQQKVIPAVLEGKNVLIISPTGSGKTESALCPVLDRHLETRGPGINVLYITPLRSLNRDMIDRIRWWAKELDISAEVRHGDTTQYQRSKQAQKPPELLVTTPETLNAILPAKRMGQHLKGVKYVIVDEVHEFAEDKRGAQLSIALERLGRVAGEFQRIGLSATIGSPEEVAHFLVGKGRGCEIVRAHVVRETDLKIECPRATEEDEKEAPYYFISADAFARIRRIRELIEGHENTLVFVNTRESAEILGSRLKSWAPGLPIAVHHSSLSKEARTRAERDMKAGRMKGIISTSSLELGIDVGSIDQVIQYMSPRQVTRLIQRVGRSGHSIHKRSKGVIVPSDFDDVCESVIVVHMARKGELEPVKMHRNALDVLANQVVGFCMDIYMQRPEEIYACVRKAHPFEDLSWKDFQDVLDLLAETHLIFRNDDGTISKSRKALFYYYENLGMIPDAKRYRVKNVVDSKGVGSLDEAFVVEFAHPGETFICKGEAWRVVDVDEEILVEPSRDIGGAIPAWKGELMPVPYEVAQKVGAMRAFIGNMVAQGMDDAGIESELGKEFDIDREAVRMIVGPIREQMKVKPVPTHDRILIEREGRHMIVHSCFGSLVNDTLSRVLCAVLMEKLGASVSSQVDPYRIILELPTRVEPELVERALMQTQPGAVKGLAIRTLENSTLARWRAFHVARKFGIISKSIDMKSISMRRLGDYLLRLPVFNEVSREIMLTKMDVPRAQEVLERIQRGKIDVLLSEGKSPLCFNKLESMAQELISPAKPEAEILKIYKQRLLTKRVQLTCMNCGWSASHIVDSVEKDPKCPECRARVLAIVTSNFAKAESIIKKQVRGEGLTKTEKTTFNKLNKTANLILSYGKNAVMTMAARGVGPDVAARVLAKRPETEVEFLRELLEAEKTFARTHRFWK